MKSKDSCVTYYTTGVATVVVNFPEDRTMCQWCPYVRPDDSLKRHRCVLTGELLVYPFATRGNECPIVFETKQNDETN